MATRNKITQGSGRRHGGPAGQQPAGKGSKHPRDLAAEIEEAWRFPGKPKVPVEPPEKKHPPR